MTVDVERHSPVATLTLNRPDTRNALSDRCLGELVDQLQLLDRGCEIGCTVIAGPERFFSAGADLDELLSREPIDIFLGRSAELWRAARQVRAPLRRCSRADLVRDAERRERCRDVHITAPRPPPGREDPPR